MKLYNELLEALNETISDTEESIEFKTRFIKLVENYFDSSCADNDINNALELIKLSEDDKDEH